MIDLTGLPFSEDVLLGIQAGVEAAEAAVCERHLVREAVLKKQFWVKRAFVQNKEDASKVTSADIMATIRILRKFKQRYGNIPVVSEEDLSGWSSVERMILIPEDYPRILEAPLALVADGVDGTEIFGEGKRGCGVLFVGMRFGKPAWVVFVGLPSVEDVVLLGIYYNPICVAEVGKGAWYWDIFGKWQRCFIKPLLAGHKPNISLGTYHGVKKDARYIPIRWFLRWLDPEMTETHSIGQAMADVACLEASQFFFHGDLLLHDRLGAEVMIPEAGGRVFHFTVSDEGRFSVRYGGVDKDYCKAGSRIGVGFGHPKIAGEVERFILMQGGLNFGDRSPFKAIG